MFIYLLLFILLQKERSLLFLDFLKQDTTLQANLLVSESLLETS
jgi:hypothetical protein